MFRKLLRKIVAVSTVVVVGMAPIISGTEGTIFSFGCEKVKAENAIRNSCEVIEVTTESGDSSSSISQVTYNNDEVNKYVLSDKNNYMAGYYESWGAGYAESQDSLCLKEKKKVSTGTYQININDSRIFFSIHEYDQNGKWIKYAGIFYDGDSFTKQENTAYITINLKSSQWGVDILSLFDQGLIVDMTNQSGDDTAESTDEPEITYNPDEVNKYVLSDKNNYMAGYYESWGAGYAESQDSLCLKEKKKVSTGTYQININDSRIFFSIHEYDQNGKWIKYAGIFYDGDSFTKQENTAYITINLKSSQWGVDVLSLFDQGLIVDMTNQSGDDTAESTDEPEITYNPDEVNKYVLSDKNNYMAGYYESWGAGYAESEDSLCLSEKKKVTTDSYYININDSRIFLSIHEYDKNGKWIKYAGSFYNGDCFTKQENTAYITINLKSSEWGVDILSLFDMGLVVDMADSFYLGDRIIVDYNNSDFNNVSNWSCGAYSTTTGLTTLNEKKVKFDNFCYMDDATYVVDLPNGSLAMNIIELDKNDTVVKSSNYQSGQQWNKDANTSYVGLSIYSTNSDTTYDSILEQMDSYGKTGLSPYTQYEHKTDMNYLTASDFVNNINVGWNLGNSLDSKASKAGLDANLKQETNWGNPYISRSLIDYVSSCGFNTIRIPVTWYYNTYEEDGHLKISENWLKRVQDVVDYAIANDMYVIMNSHHDQPIFYAGVDNVAFSKVLADADDVWTQIAEYFKTYDEHLIFESFNEIDNLERSWNFGENAASQMNELNQTFVNAVRKTGGNNAERILVVPTLLDGMKYQFLNAFDLPTDTVSDRLVVEVHTYLKKFGQDIENDFSLLEDFSNKIGTPVIIGEFGTNTSYPIPGLREEHAANFVARAASHGIKCIWWDNGSDYGIINRNNYDNSNNGIINALIDGSKGIAYSISDETLLTSFNQYVSGTLNRENGKIAASPYWGTLVTDVNGKGIPVKSGDTCAVSLNVSGDAADVWLQYIAFYDADGNLVAQVQDNGKSTFVKELQSVYYTCTVPDNASYIRVSMNSPYTNIKMSQYETFMKNGNIQLGIYFFNEEDIVQEKIF